jgi:osmotically inducible protein OsmC
MPIRKASAVWEGSLIEGRGLIKLGSGAFEGRYSFSSRFENGRGTNPEELIGAAHAGCFSMALGVLLTQKGHPAKKIETGADVTINKVGEGFKITDIALKTEADVPGIEENVFRELAETAKKTCPVSQALTGVKISLEAKLKK